MQLTTMGGPFSKEQLDIVSSYGVDSIIFWPIEFTDEWNNCIQYTRQLGMKSIATWPNWIDLGLCTNKDSFRTAFGGYASQDSTDNDCRWGPSHWHPEADDIAIASLRKTADLGFDAFLVNPRVGDNYFPICWINCNQDGLTATRQYWSWDAWAVEAWKDFSDDPMPTLSEDCTDDVFYNWYQSAFFRRLNRLTEAIETQLGYTYDIGTWMVPLDIDVPETRVLGSANSCQHLMKWYNSSNRFLAAACLFPLYEICRSTSINLLSKVAHSGKSVIIGAEAYGDEEMVSFMIRQSGSFAKQYGLDGLLMSASRFFPYSNEIHEAMRSLLCSNESE